MKREEYTKLDVEDYFNYMGMLAAEVASPPKNLSPLALTFYLLLWHMRQNDRLCSC